MDEFLDEALAELPEGMLWLTLLNHAKVVAPQIGRTPAEWLHEQVDIWISADRTAEQERRRGGLHVVP